jgi:hypothetical protein
LFVFRRKFALHQGFSVGSSNDHRPVRDCLFLVVAATVVNSPVNSLIGFAILAAGVPAFFYWRRSTLHEQRPHHAIRLHALGRLGRPLAALTTTKLRTSAGLLPISIADFDLDGAPSPHRRCATGSQRVRVSVERLVSADGTNGESSGDGGADPTGRRSADRNADL